MRSFRIGAALAGFALATSGVASDQQDYATGEAIRYTLAGSLGRGQEGPAASVNLGFHFGPLMVGAMALGATRLTLWPDYPEENHTEGALLVGYSKIDRLLFMELATGVSLSHYTRVSSGFGPDIGECPDSLAGRCGTRYEKTEAFPWGIPLELSFGIHSGALGVGFTLGANINDHAPDNYALIRVWTGFDRRFSALSEAGAFLGRAVLGPDEGVASPRPGNRTLGNLFVTGVAASLQGPGLWAEKRWDIPHAFISAGGGSSYELSDIGDARADWSVFPALQIGHGWGRGRRILTLSTGIGIFAGRDGDDRPDMFALNVPVQATYLWRYGAFSPGLLGGMMFNKPSGGYFLALVAGF